MRWYYVVGFLIVALVSFGAHQLSNTAPRAKSRLAADYARTLDAVDARVEARPSRPTSPPTTVNIAPSTPDASTPQPAPHSQTDSAELDRQLAEDIERNDALMANEPVDRRWASDAEVAFEEDLRTLPGVDVSSIDCRTTFCKAILRFESFALAHQTSSRVAQHVFRKNCAVEVYTLPPTTAGDDRPYEHEVFFDCTELRAGEYR